MTDIPEISDEERALMRERNIPARFLNSEHGHQGTLELTRAYEYRLSRTESERDALKERVERMEAENARLRGPLQSFVNGVATGAVTTGYADETLANVTRRAREALAGKAAPVVKEE